MPVSNDPPPGDEELLRAWAREGNQLAFRRVVERHHGLVTGIVRRQVNDAGAAEEAVQNVFAILARKASSARARPSVAGWLCRTALFESRRAQRRAAQAQRRMKNLFDHYNPDGGRDDTPPVWREALPHLDHALANLPQGDRDVLLMRFHEKKSFRDIAVTLGKSEDASQKQAERALEKVARLLRRRGVTLGVAMLATGLAGALSSKAAPDPQAVLQTHVLAKRAAEAAPGIGRLTLIQHSLETMDHPKTVTFIATILLAAVPLGLVWRDNHSLRQEMAALKSGGESASGNGEAALASAGPNRPHNRLRQLPKIVNGKTGQPSGPRGDWASVVTDPDPVRRGAELHRLIGSLTADEAQGAGEALWEAKKNNSVNEGEWQLFLRAWGGVDGESALAWFKTKVEPVTSDGGVSIMAGWASHNPAKAQTWLQSQIDEANQSDGAQQRYGWESLIRGIGEGMAVNDRSGAIDWVMQRATRGDYDPNNAAAWMMSQVDKNDPGAGAALIARVPSSVLSGLDNAASDPVRAALLNHVAPGLSAKEGAALAAQWQHVLRPDTVETLARNLSNEDNAGAMKWLDSLNAVSAADKGGARTAVISMWTGKDPDAAAAWMSQKGRREDPAYASQAVAFAQSAAPQDPAAAVAWISTVNDPQQQRGALVEMARSSMQRGDNEAVEIMRTSGVAEDILKEAQQRPLSMNLIYGLQNSQNAWHNYSPASYQWGHQAPVTWDTSTNQGVAFSPDGLIAVQPGGEGAATAQIQIISEASYEDVTVPGGNQAVAGGTFTSELARESLGVAPVQIVTSFVQSQAPRRAIPHPPAAP